LFSIMKTTPFLFSPKNKNEKELIPVSTTYGWRKTEARRIPMPPPYATSYEHPVLPEKVYNDSTAECEGCPYPRHGLFCRDEDGNCLRTDMRELEEKWREQRRKKRRAMPPCPA
jgi:hypothetical protein